MLARITLAAMAIIFVQDCSAEEEEKSTARDQLRAFDQRLRECRTFQIKRRLELYEVAGDERKLLGRGTIATASKRDAGDDDPLPFTFQHCRAELALDSWHTILAQRGDEAIWYDSQAGGYRRHDSVLQLVGPTSATMHLMIHLYPFKLLDARSVQSARDGQMEDLTINDKLVTCRTLTGDWAPPDPLMKDLPPPEFSGGAAAAVMFQLAAATGQRPRRVQYIPAFDADQPFSYKIWIRQEPASLAKIRLSGPFYRNDRDAEGGAKRELVRLTLDDSFDAVLLDELTPRDAVSLDVPADAKLLPLK
jgi:hypothetical protein